MVVTSIDELFTPAHIRKYRNRHRQLWYDDIAHHHARSIQALFSKSAQPPSTEVLESAVHGPWRLLLRMKQAQFSHFNVEDQREPRVRSMFLIGASHDTQTCHIEKRASILQTY